MTDSARQKTATRAAAPAVKPPAPVASVIAARVQRQSLRVSSPKDPAEREADATAKKVMRMEVRESPSIARFADSVPHLARKGDGSGGISPAIANEIQQSTGSGSPLPPSTRQFMEARFRADFSRVRIHTGDRAAKLSRQLNAQAFTVGNQVFFGKDRFQPESAEGRELIAHELTHTIQQGAAVQRSADVTVSERSGPEVQRLGISDALDYFADAANAIPGYRMFTIVLGVNPINMSRVERSAANILRAVVELIPGGNLLTRALDNYGVFDKVGNWVEAQLRTLGITGGMIRDAIMSFLDSLGWRDIFRLGSVWNRAKRIFTEPIDRIIAFVRSLVAAILKFIREAILRPIAQLASRTRAWDLLCAVMGQNPITGEAVPRNAETLIGGFMKLIGQEEIWQNIKKGNAIARAWAWFQGALGALLGFVRQIPGLFIRALESLELSDLVLLPRAFGKVASVFGGFVADFLRWAGEATWNLLEIIFSVVAPGVMVYLRRARAAFRTIIKDPVRFVRTLVRAAMQGFRQFATNFLTHLRAALVGWLTGAMSGANIHIPQAFTLQEILKFVLSVLGLTWQNVRQKLVRAIGETAVVVLERSFDIVVTLVTQGPAAAWEKIVESINNLRELVIEQVMSFVKDRVVTAAITRLLSMLSPAGAFIQAIIATYNTVMFFVERLRQIAQVAASFIDSISAIANGVISAAANRVEQTMAGLLVLVISFLARIAGLGRVSDAVTNVINQVRQPIDRALDRVVEWIVSTARRLGRLAAQGAQAVARRVANWWAERRQMRLGDDETHTLRFARSGQRSTLMLASEEKPVQQHLQEAIAGSELDDAAKGRAREALEFFSSHIARITLQPVPDPAPPDLQALIDALPDNLNTLAAKLVAISQGSDVALPAAPTFSAGGPQRSSAELLTNRTSRRGQRASAGEPKGWPSILARGLTQRNGSWVRMHMVTAGVGGQDVSGNLLPAPTAINTGGVVRGFETQVERILYGDTPASAVRRARSLFKRLTRRNAVIWVETTTGGFWPAFTDPATGQLLYDATTFAQSVSFKAGIYVPRSNAWTRDPTAMVQATVGIPEPSFAGTFQPNLNDIGEPLIARLAGIDPHVAREIVAERGGTPARSRLTNPADLGLRMMQYRQRQGVAVTPEFRQAITAVLQAIVRGRMTL